MEQMGGPQSVRRAAIVVAQLTLRVRWAPLPAALRWRRSKREWRTPFDADHLVGACRPAGRDPGAPPVDGPVARDHRRVPGRLAPVPEQRPPRHSRVARLRLGDGLARASRPYGSLRPLAAAGAYQGADPAVPVKGLPAPPAGRGQ